MAENSVYEGTCATRQVAALSNEVCDEFPLWPYGEFLRRQSLHISTNIFVELYIYILIQIHPWIFGANPNRPEMVCVPKHRTVSPEQKLFLDKVRGGQLQLEKTL